MLLLAAEPDALTRINVPQLPDVVQPSQLNNFPQLLRSELVSLQLPEELLIAPQGTIA
jgi:hypothetical protein